MSESAGSLAGFLLARYGEREDAAKRAMGDPAEYIPERWDLGVVRSVVGAGAPPNIVVHISYCEPARILADLKANRRIVEQYVESQACALDEAHDPDSLTECAWRGQGLHEAVTILASVFADHPDYEEAWKPWKL